MSPAATMDNSMPSSSSSLLNILQLAEDGSNWVTYKHHMTIALGARGVTTRLVVVI
jgi:3-dehydroquinate dehydratase